MLVMVAALSACTTTATTTTTASRSPEAAPVAKLREDARKGVLDIWVSGKDLKVGDDLVSADFDEPYRIFARSQLGPLIGRNKRDAQHSARVTIARDSSSQTLAEVLEGLMGRIHDVELIMGQQRASMKLGEGRGRRLALVLDGRTRPAIGHWFLEPGAVTPWSPANAASDEAIARSLGPLCEDDCQVSLWVRDATSAEDLFGALRVFGSWQKRLPGLGLWLEMVPRWKRKFTGEPSGTMPYGMIQPVVSTNHAAVRTCYDEGRAKTPGLSGFITLRFVIDPEGKVSSVKDESSDIPEAVRDCVLKSFRRLVFPTHEGKNISATHLISLPSKY